MDHGHVVELFPVKTHLWPFTFRVWSDGGWGGLKIKKLCLRKNLRVRVVFRRVGQGSILVI